MLPEVDRFTINDLRTLASACHDLATRYLVRFIDARDQEDIAAADQAWERYQRYWQAETAAVTTDEVAAEDLPDALKRLLDDPETEAEVSGLINDRLPAY